MARPGTAPPEGRGVPTVPKRFGHSLLTSEKKRPKSANKVRGCSKKKGRDEMEIHLKYQEDGPYWYKRPVTCLHLFRQ